MPAANRSAICWVRRRTRSSREPSWGTTSGPSIWPRGPSASYHIATVYSDRGHGVRPPIVFYNRANEAGALLKPGDFDWAGIFGRGVRWFHSGGIFSALSETTSELVVEGMQAAKAAGAVTFAPELLGIDLSDVQLEVGESRLANRGPVRAERRGRRWTFAQVEFAGPGGEVELAGRVDPGIDTDFSLHARDVDLKALEWLHRIPGLAGRLELRCQAKDIGRGLELETELAADSVNDLKPESARPCSASRNSFCSTVSICSMASPSGEAS